jgi:response regulator RpfG family c-di-GMP phosphodiesterase
MNLVAKMNEPWNEDKFSVLIVDDIDANLFALRKTLEYYCPDFEIVEARSGEEALRKMLQHRSDLALIDIQMPGMSGFELVHLLKKRQSTASVPVIFLTAVFKSEEFRSQGFALGAVDYLSKPYDELFLINKVMAFYYAIKRERELKREILAARDSMYEAQKREAMATMVAGVAHDFNNLIGSIQGFVELAVDEVDADSSIALYLEQIGISVERAKKLIDQMRFVKLNELTLKPLSCSELMRTFKNGFVAYLRSNGFGDVEVQIAPLVEDL